MHVGSQTSDVKGNVQDNGWQMDAEESVRAMFNVLRYSFTLPWIKV